MEIGHGENPTTYDKRSKSSSQNIKKVKTNVVQQSTSLIEADERSEQSNSSERRKRPPDNQPMVAEEEKTLGRFNDRAKGRAHSRNHLHANQKDQRKIQKDCEKHIYNILPMLPLKLFVNKAKEKANKRDRKILQQKKQKNTSSWGRKTNSPTNNSRASLCLNGAEGPKKLVEKERVSQNPKKKKLGESLQLKISFIFLLWFYI